LGGDARTAQRYFAELLRAALTLQGVDVGAAVSWVEPSEGSAMKGGAETTNSHSPIYLHKNSRTLSEMVKPMMKYSTNFVANQLALNLSADLLGAPASEAKVLLAYRQRLSELFGWQNFHIEDGAGLSRKNQLSPQQLIEVLEQFEPWRHLLPEIEPGVYAKSGTLIGVSTLAGYIKTESDWLPFALMLNEKVPYHYRNKLAHELSQYYLTY